MSIPAQAGALAAETAARCLRAGGVVAYPTEGVFGLGCDPGNVAALNKLLDIKQRDPAKGLILIAAGLEQLDRWIAPLDAGARAQLAKDWPGPVTWVMPALPDVPAFLTGDRDTLACRVTAHPPTAALCRAFGSAIVSTSANRSGEPPLAREALMSLPGIDGVLDGELGGLGAPTPVRDWRSGRTLRA